MKFAIWESSKIGEESSSENAWSGICLEKNGRSEISVTDCRKVVMNQTYQAPGRFAGDIFSFAL